MTDQFSGGPGFLAFVVTFAMVGALLVLFRSLSSHLRKVRTHPPESVDKPSAGPEEDDGTRDEVADEPGDR